MTSTSLEGEAEKNPLAVRGYSRDHRPDCKQVNLALVVSRCGMPLGCEVFAGMQPRLYHLGFRNEVARSTLAKANEQRDWRI